MGIAEDGAPWTASFSYAPESGGADEVELAVAPDIAVVFPAPEPLKSRPRRAKPRGRPARGPSASAPTSAAASGGAESPSKSTRSPKRERGRRDRRDRPRDDPGTAGGDRAAPGAGEAQRARPCRVAGRDVARATRRWRSSMPSWRSATPPRPSATPSSLSATPSWPSATPSLAERDAAVAERDTRSCRARRGRRRARRGRRRARRAVNARAQALTRAAAASWNGHSPTCDASAISWPQQLEEARAAAIPARSARARRTDRAPADRAAVASLPPGGRPTIPSAAPSPCGPRAWPRLRCCWCVLAALALIAPVRLAASPDFTRGWPALRGDPADRDQRRGVLAGAARRHRRATRARDRRSRSIALRSFSPRCSERPRSADRPRVRASAGDV